MPIPVLSSEELRLYSSWHGASRASSFGPRPPPGSCKSRGRVDATQAIPRIQFIHGVLATKRTLCITAFDQWLGLCQGCSREDFGSGSLKTSFCTMVSKLSFICVNSFLADPTLHPDSVRRRFHERGVSLSKIQCLLVPSTPTHDHPCPTPSAPASCPQSPASPLATPFRASSSPAARAGWRRRT
jgi:hypothetical protein